MAQIAVSSGVEATNTESSSDLDEQQTTAEKDSQIATVGQQFAEAKNTKKRDSKIKLNCFHLLWHCRVQIRPRPISMQRSLRPKLRKTFIKCIAASSIADQNSKYEAYQLHP